MSDPPPSASAQLVLKLSLDEDMDGICRARAVVVSFDEDIIKTLSKELPQYTPMRVTECDGSGDITHFSLGLTRDHPDLPKAEASLIRQKQKVLHAASVTLAEGTRIVVKSVKHFPVHESLYEKQTISEPDKHFVFTAADSPSPTPAPGQDAAQDAVRKETLPDAPKILKDPPGREVSPHELKPGVPVYGEWRKKNGHPEWHLGKVVKLGGDGTFIVEYHDGDIDEGSAFVDRPKRHCDLELPRKGIKRPGTMLLGGEESSTDPWAKLYSVMTSAGGPEFARQVVKGVKGLKGLSGALKNRIIRRLVTNFDPAHCLLPQRLAEIQTGQMSGGALIKMVIDGKLRDPVDQSKKQKVPAVGDPAVGDPTYLQYCGTPVSLAQMIAMKEADQA
jgi:hypothetical protein